MKPRKTLHLISQSHLDPVWLWPVRDGAAEALCTMQSAVDRAAETPEFRYSRSSAAVYQWAKDRDPRLHDDIRRLVAQGRWEIVGGWVEQADCNLPSGESFLRQALYAKRFLREEFGAAGDTGIGYAPDSFGHAGGLPQLLVRGGFTAWAFMRPDPWDNPEIPLLFHWEAPDGSRVLGIHIPMQYSQSYAATADDVEHKIREAVTGNFAPDFEHAAFWLGIGNHGGGPTKAHIARILELRRDDSLPELRFSSVRDFEAAVRQSPAFASLPVVRGELGYTLRGCYAATSEVKLLNRLAEKSLFAAESLAAVEQQGPRPQMAEAWWRLLLNQFHDILAGTCVASVQQETRARFGAVLTAAAELRESCAARQARRVDTSGEKGSVLFACNPLPWPRKALVSFDTFREPNGVVEVCGLESRDGSRQFPIQWLSADANFGPYGMRWGKQTAVLDLPACGHEVFRVLTKPLAAAPATAAGPTEAPAAGTALVSSPDAAEVLPQTLVSLKDKEGREILGGPVGTVVVEDPAGTWGHGIKAYDHELGRPESQGTERMEDGPLLRRHREIVRWQDSVIWVDTTRFRHTDAVELRFRILWRAERAILKLEIPLKAEASGVLVKMPAEVAERAADGNEYPCHDWLQVATAAGTLGVINDGTYAYDVQPGRIRFILARGIPFAEHPPFGYHDTRHVEFTDQHWIERRFLLVPGARRPGELDRLAQEFQIPAELVPDNGHGGDQPWSGEGLRVEPDSISVLAIKPAEQGIGTVLRIQEFSGTRNQARIAWRGRIHDLELAAWEILTLRLDADGGIARISALEL